MARSLEELLKSPVQREVRPNVWVPAGPMRGPLILRLQDAWLVLTGNADAITWPADNGAGLDK